MRAYKYLALIILTFISFDTFAQSSSSGNSFNLVCNGLWSFGEPKDYLRVESLPKEMRWSNVYRIDLEKRKWCSNNCEEILELYTISDNEIIFKNKKDGYELSELKVNRQSGRLESLFEASADGKKGIRIQVSANCEKSSFTGFPALKF